MLKDYPDIMTVEDCADALQLNKTTIYHLIEKKKIPATRIGKSYRISKKKMIEYVESGNA